MSQTIHSVVAKGKDVAANDEAVHALAASQSENLEEIAVQMGNSCKVAEVSKSEDITESFLQTVKFIGPEKLKSSSDVYKGLVHELMGRVNDHHMNAIGVMAGMANDVIEVCVADDLSSILSSDELKKTLESVGL